MKNFVSIVTPTKNRAPLLKECLVSLRHQTQQIDELVIVDNGSTDETQRVIADFKRVLPIRSLRVTSYGYPKLYNAGIAAARGNWVVLFDDDCVASTGWFAAVKKSTIAFPGAAIQGKTISIPKNNLYAQIMGDHYINWIEANRIGGNKLRTFDNKNLCIPRLALEKVGVFNETLSAGSEDIELGFRFTRFGIPIYYAPSIVAYHRERTTFKGFISQHARIAHSESLLADKLSSENQIPVVPPRVFLHLRSALLREWQYVKSGRMLDALRLPIIYLLLVCVRVYHYKI